MRKSFLLLPLLVVACAEAPTKIGSDFFREGALDVSYVDSSTVNTSTVQFEDLVTNTTGRILVGSHVDEKLGRVTALGYFQAGVSSILDLSNENVSPAYAAIVIRCDGYAFYDTSASMTINVHQVQQALQSDDGYLYGTNSFLTNEVPLGKTTFLPRPHRSDSIEIILNEDFYQALYLKALAGDEDLKSTTEFTEYIRGFALIPDSTKSSAVVGFAATPELRFYYYDKSETPARLKYKSFPTTTGLYSTNYRINRMGTSIVRLEEDEKMESSSTDDQSYIQGGSGLGIRIDIPYLRDLRQYPNFYVVRAVLDVNVVYRSFDKYTPLPSSLLVYVVDRRNGIISEETLSATLVPDPDLERDTHYQIDVTSFVNSQMDLQSFNENGLIMLLPDGNLNKTVDRIYFDNNNQTRLRIYYATINN